MRTVVIRMMGMEREVLRIAQLDESRERGESDAV